MEFLERVAISALTAVLITTTAVLTAKALNAIDKKAVELFNENKEK